MIRETRIAPLQSATIHATVFEDNAGTYFLVRNQRLTSRTKYFSAKWHHFWSLYPKEFSIVKCPTASMLADYLTKPLPRAAYESNRDAVQGW